MKGTIRSSRPRQSGQKDLGSAERAVYRRTKKRRTRYFTDPQFHHCACAQAISIKTNEVIVGLQTEAPLKRAIMPNGGLRMVLNALKTYGYEPDPHVVEAFTKYRKTHNEGVFDAYTADIRRCRSSHILTGLPDAYGRGRIIGDYRRVALYGVARLIERKQEEKTQSRPCDVDRCDHSRSRRTQRTNSLAERTATDGARAMDLTFQVPARNAREAVQWLYFGYLAAVKEQNGAAMSLGRTSTFLDIYFQRDLKAGMLTEEQAQEIIDDFVIKLRIVRFLRTPEYDELSPEIHLGY